MLPLKQPPLPKPPKLRPANNHSMAKAMPRFCSSLAFAALCAAALASCDPGAPQPAGGVSKGEAEALAQAAEMLDQTRTLPDEALPEVAPPADAPAAPEIVGDNAR